MHNSHTHTHTHTHKRLFLQMTANEMDPFGLVFVEAEVRAQGYAEGLAAGEVQAADTARYLARTHATAVALEVTVHACCCRELNKTRLHTAGILPRLRGGLEGACRPTHMGQVCACIVVPLSFEHDACRNAQTAEKLLEQIQQFAQTDVQDPTMQDLIHAIRTAFRKVRPGRVCTCASQITRSLSS